MSRISLEYVDTVVYRQHGDILIHLVNLNTQGFEPGYAERVFDISPVKIHMTSQRSYRLATQSDVEDVKIWNTESGFTVNIPCLKEQALIRLTPLAKS